MKKSIVVLFTCLFLFSLSGCGGGPKQSEQSSSLSSAENSSLSSSSSSTVPESPSTAPSSQAPASSLPVNSGQVALGTYLPKDELDYDIALTLEEKSYTLSIQVAFIKGSITGGWKQEGNELILSGDKVDTPVYKGENVGEYRLQSAGEDTLLFTANETLQGFGLPKDPVTFVLSQ